MFKSRDEMLFIFSGVMNLVVTATGDLDIKDKITAVSTNVSQEGVHIIRFQSNTKDYRLVKFVCIL